MKVKQLAIFYIYYNQWKGNFYNFNWDVKKITLNWFSYYFFYQIKKSESTKLKCINWCIEIFILPSSLKTGWTEIKKNKAT